MIGPTASILLISLLSPRSCFSSLGSICTICKQRNVILPYTTRISVNPTGPRKCRLTWGDVRRLACMMSRWRFWCHFLRLDIMLMSFLPNVSKRSLTEHFLIEKSSYFGVKLIKQYIVKPKCNCRRKSMQEKESVMVVWCELKIPSLGITVRHHSASLVMPKSYPRDGVFNPHLTTNKDSYIL